MSKYEIVDLVVPPDKREEINQKCLYVIENDLSDIPAEYIANAYTGDGGLHGLKRSDYRNYVEYSDAKKEFENGQFFTPSAICQWVCESLQVTMTDSVADLTCGHGAFFNHLPYEENLYGCELDSKAYKVARFLYPQAEIKQGSVEFYRPKQKFDVIVGNPPFGLKIAGMSSEIYYMEKAAKLLKPAGILAVVVPMSFLSDEMTHKHVIEAIDEKYSFIAGFRLSEKSFADLGVSSYATKILFFYKRSDHTEHTPFDLNAIQDISEWSSACTYGTYLKPVFEQKERVRYQLHKEALMHRSENFAAKVTKLMFDIKQNGNVKRLLHDAQNFVDNYLTQKRPEGVTEKEWERQRVHSKDVILYLRNILKNQHKVERDEIRLVKTDYGLRRKAYSKTSQSELDASDEIAYKSFNDMVLHCSYPFEDGQFKKLFRKKQAAYRVQTIEYSEMDKDATIGKFLDNGKLYDYVNEEFVMLNPKQNDDTNLFLQKRYAFAQWSQGTGKTITGLYQSLYRMMHKQVRNVVVLSSAISIKNNWVEVLSEQFQMGFIFIQSISDFGEIQDGQFILITFDMLSKLKRQMQKFVKTSAHKLLLVCDESDCLTNPYSVRTLAALACFRRLKYKLLLTGTSTRNNICEFFPQLELLYNNSINMVCKCDELYYHGSNSVKKGQLYSDVELSGAGFAHDETICTERNNEYYMKPFPPFRAGFALFSSCFLPDKITVLGIAQKTQDIYNSEILKDLLAYTVITRTFEEIVGKKIYELHQMTCQFTEAETKIYTTALKEFYKLEHLFNMPKNSRKAAALKILNQLILLLRICAAPQTIPEYDKSVIPGKFEMVLGMLEDWKDERVAIGVRHVNVVDAYKLAIEKRFPGRPVISITGNRVSLAERKKIIKRLKTMPTAILISTQQSLSCSVNIDFIDKCILPELHYNNSGMSQYYFRFIRYTSKNPKHIYFATYQDSIESNLMKMILVKEKLNYFMKQNELNDDEVYEQFGITAGMLENLMYKEKTDDGKMEIRWGKQNIA